MCLCPRCAKQFYDSEQHTIKRTDPDQTVKDHCDWCSVRFGYDYTISNNTDNGDDQNEQDKPSRSKRNKRA
jgi:mRNA interferase MazF